MIARAATVALVVAACSAPPLPVDLAAAYERERAGDVEGALAAYQRAAERACAAPRRGRPTRSDCGRALLDRARLLAETGRLDAAIEAYAAIEATTQADPPPSAEGLYQAGRLAYRVGRIEVAAGYLWAAVEQYPDEAFAADALGFVVARTRTDAATALWDRLVGLYEPLRDTDVADNLLWALAELAAAERAAPRVALDLYDRLPIDHPTSGLRDDARWHAARISRQLGDAAGAATRLRALLATREVAFGAGSYFSVWLDDAQLALARLLRDRLADPAGAARAFARLPRDYPRSILVDDALAELAALEETRGQPAAACRAAAELLRRDPASRHAADATARAARLGCPGAGR